MTKAAHGSELTRDLFLCCADGEGSQEFRVCADHDDVFAFYEEMTGRDQDGTLDSITKSFGDPDEWRNDGRAFKLKLYCADFYVWKVTDKEIALRALPDAETPGAGGNCCCAEHHINHGRCLQCPVHGIQPPEQRGPETGLDQARTHADAGPVTAKADPHHEPAPSAAPTAVEGNELLAIRIARAIEAGDEAQLSFTKIQIAAILTDGVLDLARRLDEELRWKEMSVTEIAAFNQSVAEYCKHWEGRAEAAEQRVRELEHQSGETTVRDAERYRWLRLNWMDSFWERVIDTEDYSFIALDAAIDAALSARPDALSAAEKSGKEG